MLFFVEWGKDALRAFFWMIVIVAILLFSTGTYSQFIYTDF